jgi:hypothetical protein
LLKNSVQSRQLRRSAFLETAEQPKPSRISGRGSVQSVGEQAVYAGSDLDLAFLCAPPLRRKPKFVTHNSLRAADVYPVPTGAHGVLGQIVTQFQVGIFQETAQPCPKRQGVVARLGQNAFWQCIATSYLELAGFALYLGHDWDEVTGDGDLLLAAE